LDNYLNPALKGGWIEMRYPDNPNHPKQGYRLTQDGLKLMINNYLIEFFN